MSLDGRTSDMASFGFLRRIGRRAAILGLANAAFLLLYLFFAHLVWVRPGKEGLDTASSEPFIWTLTAFPVLFFALIMDIIWLATFIKAPPKRNELLCTAAVFLIWIAAIVFDFAHHPS